MFPSEKGWSTALAASYFILDTPFCVSYHPSLPFDVRRIMFKYNVPFLGGGRLTQPITGAGNKARRACRYFGAAFHCIRRCTHADNVLMDWYPCARPRISDEARGKRAIPVYFMHYRVCTPFRSFPGQVELSLIDERHVVSRVFHLHSQRCSKYKHMIVPFTPRIGRLSVFISSLANSHKLGKLFW